MSDLTQERHIQAAIEASSKHYLQYHTALEELGKKDVELANLKAVNKSQECKITILESNLKFALELIEAETIPISVKGETAPPTMHFEVMMPF